MKLLGPNDSIFVKKVFPETRLFPNELIRKDGLRRAVRHSYVSWVNMIAVGVWIIAVVQLKLWVATVVDVSGLLLAVLVGILVASGLNLPLLISRRAIRRDLRRQLNDLGIPVCLECGCRFEQLPSLNCPGCGAEFDPELLVQKSDGNPSRARR